jgi:prepilin-type N-terminal cleavage/methylation domain-containing protein
MSLRRSFYHDPARSRGFTLIELLVVMIIISIILGLIFIASMEAAHRAEERATQSLITKLEGGLNDRLEALLQNVPDPNAAHAYMSACYFTGADGNNYPILPPTASVLDSLAQSSRAKVIATTDFIKSQMPDVFFVQSDTNYPINFAGMPYDAGGTAASSPLAGSTAQSNLTNYASVMLPIGTTLTNDPANSSYGDAPAASSNLLVNNPYGTGIFGAAYTVAAGIYKNLGYVPQGYDGVDNDGDGLVDNLTETSATLSTVQANLANHSHQTARAEMLYALLVESSGPLGSVFSRDDFTSKEVMDTDQDGLPEFVDAWGQPLQFFRWPLLYHSDIQRGQVIAAGSLQIAYPYDTVFENREQNPLDPNQQLVAPAWWSSFNANFPIPTPSIMPSYSNVFTANPSTAVACFESLFHRVTEPIPSAGGQLFWDRGTNYGSRRAFYSKFLVLSGGLDQQLGVFIYPDATLPNPVPAANTLTVTLSLIANENNALPFFVGDPVPVADFTTSPVLQMSPGTAIVPPTPYTPYSTYWLLQSALDDISNQNIQTSVKIGGS